MIKNGGNLFVLPIKITDCPFTFWKNYEPDNLKNVAYKFVYIPATFVPLERVFSNAGLFMTNRKSSLKSKNLNVLIFLHQNVVDAIIR